MRLIGLIVGAALALVAPAQAAEYELFIAIDNEEDLYDLLADDQISEATFQTLIELYRRGVDLERASREELYALPNLSYRDVDAIIDYRRAAGSISSPAALVAAGVLTAPQLMAIAPFLLVGPAVADRTDVSGWVRAPALWVPDSPGPPPGALQLRLGSGDIAVGAVGVVTHGRLGQVAFDPYRMTLSAEPPATRPHLAKLFVQYERDATALIAGSFTAGFGQRLTFDNTDRYTPNGLYFDDTVYRGTALARACKESRGELAESPCAGSTRYTYRAPDYRWRETLLGAAAGLRHHRLGSGWLQAYGFASAAPRSIYQYELYNPTTCADPDNDGDPGCAAPQVVTRRPDLLEPTAAVSYQTLPAMYRETLLGGNVSYFSGRRTHVGLTAYGADIRWLARGIDLDFQEWSSRPRGGSFGAIGIDAAWGQGTTDLFVEVARSLDSTPGGGGDIGALVRSVTASGPGSEIEASVRYYGRGFANPYARPIAAADELDGSRARDELGARVRYTARLGRRLHVRTSADLWTPASDLALPRVALYARGDYEYSRRWRYGAWTSYQNKAITDNSHRACAEVPEPGQESDPPAPCGGQTVHTAARVRWQPQRRLDLSTQLQLTWQDDDATAFADEFRNDLSAWLTVGAWPTTRLRVRARARYLYENVCWVRDSDYGMRRGPGQCLSDLLSGSANDRNERSLWTYLDAAYRFAGDYRLRLRYDLLARLDHRDSTAARTPSPEHWLLFEAEARF
jgi:hypothetical protein